MAECALTAAAVIWWPSAHARTHHVHQGEVALHMPLVSVEYHQPPVFITVLYCQ
eukprot:COSAG01_NODE_1384_length_10514_cov_17.435046_5_plen_54_part_00